MSIKLLQLFRTFSQDEIEAFEGFIGANLVQLNSKSIQLFNFLKPYYPDFPIEDKDWEAAFSKIYEGRPMDWAEMRNKQSLLKGAILDFWAWKELQERRQERELMALSQIRKRGLQDIFVMERKRLRKAWEKLPIRSEDMLFAKYRLADEANILYGESQVRRADQNLLAKLENLDNYYLRVRLRESCEILNRQQLLNTEQQDNFFHAWLEKQIREEKRVHDPGIAIYLQIYKCYQQSKDEGEFIKLVELIKANHQRFQIDEVRAFFRHAQNHSIRNINQGSKFYLTELFELFRFQLEKEIIFHNGLLDHSDYKNIVVVALRLERYDWTETFVKKYTEAVHPKYRENVYQFCQASLLEARGKQTEAIRFLREVSFSDIFYEISSRILLIRLYYENEDWEGLFYANDAFERFLKRTKIISRDRKVAHLSFTWAMRQLGKLKERKMGYSLKDYQAKKAKLKQKVIDKGQMTQLKWVLEQLEEKEKPTSIF